MQNDAFTDPLVVLGLAPGADDSEIRRRYLELVRRHPPEREPDLFREIHAAYELARDPLLMARKLLSPPVSDVTQWSDIIDQHAKIPPTLSVNFLLSLGNRDDSVSDNNQPETTPPKEPNQQTKKVQPIQGQSNE